MASRADGSESSDSRASASVLLNGMRVLETFSITEPVLGVTEIARKVDMHKSRVSRMLATLEKGGYVERDTESGRFRLGLGLIALAGPLLADLDVRRVAYPTLEQLTSRTRETSALMVWNGHESVVVEQVPSPQHVKHTSTIGTRYDTADSASVQIFVAHLPAAEVERLFERRLLAGPGDAATIADYQALLEQVRSTGFAINDGRTSVEEVGIAAPVHDHRGERVAAVLLSAPRFRIPATMLDSLGHSVADAAREVSARLGNRR